MPTQICMKLINILFHHDNKITHSAISYRPYTVSTLTITIGAPEIAGLKYIYFLMDTQNNVQYVKLFNVKVMPNAFMNFNNFKTK